MRGQRWRQCLDVDVGIMFSLTEEAANIQLISSLEIKVSVMFADNYVELAAQALHRAFGLNQNKLAAFGPY